MTSNSWSPFILLHNAVVSGMHHHLHLYGTGDWLQYFVHSRKALWKQKCTGSLNYRGFFFRKFGKWIYINELYLWKPVIHPFAAILFFNSGTKFGYDGIYSWASCEIVSETPYAQTHSLLFALPNRLHRGAAGSSLWAGKWMPAGCQGDLDIVL